jgi:four helix bundle suffix protein
MSSNLPLTPNSNYHGLLSFAMASLIYDAVTMYCDRNYDYKNDPLGKMRGQRIGAAQSAIANIAEGSARGGTSRETEARLMDVARASLVELYVYCESDLRQKRIIPWKHDDQTASSVRTAQIEPFKAEADVAQGFFFYMQQLTENFHETLFSQDAGIALNSMLILCSRCIQLLRRQIETIIRETVENGGFTERLSQARIIHRNIEERGTTNAPKCPVCGGEMVERLAKRGVNAGRTFWSCKRYPDCNGTRPGNQ